ncbi:hypothetical protein F5144DRAFT_588220 [Chaetomium tenue]|uniref:Uncharacterized protein n=1 Tax=Chaetomium tenue TaxID=1854479 RepID=A0ACB7PQF0_9PEZI|nr:hypothetical protein F5144DRAFT_588220 [Chaetomium globosum]
MVRRALSHRRGSNLKLEVDTASTAASTPTYVSIPVIVRTGTARRESLPLSRHHLMRRSSSVSSRSTASSSSFAGSSGSSSNRGADLYDGGSVIVDDIDEELEGELTMCFNHTVYGFESNICFSHS